MAAPLLRRGAVPSRRRCPTDVLRRLVSSEAAPERAPSLPPPPQMPPFEHRSRPYAGMGAAEILEKRKTFLGSSLFHYYQKPLNIVEGKMQYLYDEHGKRYLDCFGGIVTVSCGHCHPDIVNAVVEQTKLLQHTTTIYLHQAIVEFAEALASKMPGNLKVVYFINSGTEANELAMFMARLYSGNLGMIALRNAYHGGSAGTIGLTGLQTWKYPIPQVILLFVMGFIAGGFILGAVHNAILLIVVVVIFVFVAALLIWNACWGRRGAVGFVNRYPDTDLRTAKDGQYVKATGVVTCGNLPLESSFQRVPRCVCTSTSLYEYRGWDSKAANTEHRRFTWGLRSMERHVVDFYISDFQSGLRALVKTGYGALVTPYVDESVVIDINPDNKDMSPEFLRWLREISLSSDDRIMRLKEGKKKAVHKTTTTDDKRLQSTLKKNGVNTIPGIEEVSIFKDDVVIQFQNPKSASIHSCKYMGSQWSTRQKSAWLTTKTCLIIV